MTHHKQQVIEFLRSFETGDSKPLSYIDPERYIQHNLNLGDDLAAPEARLKSRPKGSVKANTVRAFEDGELVFTHTEFNFSGNSRIAFDIRKDRRALGHAGNVLMLAAITQRVRAGRGAGAATLVPWSAARKPFDNH